MFKVGDKVRIHDCEGDPEYNGRIGTLIETGRAIKTGTNWDYLCKFEDACNYPFGSPEMEIVITKGQQLLFAFME